LKLLVTGASGLFGSKLTEIALAKGIQVYAGYSKDQPSRGFPVVVDVSNKNQVEQAFAVAQPDVVVHAASLTDVDKCELDHELAWKINVDGTKNVAEAAAKSGAFLVYISTDYVFSGEKGCYKETDQTDPINYYGLTKLKAEETAMQYVPNCCVARPSVIYGATPAVGKINFALWLINKLKSGEKLRIVTNQWNSPTLNTNLAEMVLDVVEQRLAGVFHLCGASRVSRYDFALEVAKTFGLDEGLIEPVDASSFNWPAKRPADSSLDVSKAQRLLTVKPLELTSALAQLKTELKNF
jgi:dTDP-4-dehydrorhamnose reductase